MAAMLSGGGGGGGGGGRELNDAESLWSVGERHTMC